MATELPEGVKSFVFDLPGRRTLSESLNGCRPRAEAVEFIRVSDLPKVRDHWRAQLRDGLEERLRGMGNADLAYLFETKTTEELRAEIETWDLPDDLRGEMLAFVKLLEGEEESADLDRDVGGVAPELKGEQADEWPYPDEEPPDPL